MKSEKREELGVRIRVITDQVSFCHHPAEECFVSFYLAPDTEEAGGYLILFEYVQYAGRFYVVRSVIESQGYNFIGGPLPVEYPDVNIRPDAVRSIEEEYQCDDYEYGAVIGRSF